MSALSGAGILFLGHGAGPSYYRWASGVTDAGSPITARAKSNRVAPAGIGGEAVFTGLFATIVHTAQVTARFTPIVDDVPFDGVSAANAVLEVTLPQPTSGRRTWWRKELGLSQPLVLAGVDRGRFALRGTWFQLLVELSGLGLTVDGALGEALFDGVDLEWAPARVSTEAVPSPAVP